jgi:hypothetical protein
MCRVFFWLSNEMGLSNNKIKSNRTWKGAGKQKSSNVGERE